jgi:NADPH:quinone reductase-like Zn-dependent oxidoreductase
LGVSNDSLKFNPLAYLMPSQPILLLAFANDRQGAFLRSIAQEHDAILSALNRGPAQVVSIPAASASRIVETFQRDRDKIKGFHYGGHADGDNLLLDSASGQGIDAGSFADFLSNQQGLKFVFLNGCSTLEQARKLRDAGIDHVIVTNRVINDEAAMKFAAAFYGSIASGADVPKAFHEASAAVLLQNGGQMRSLFWEGLEANQAEDGNQPWELFNRIGITKLWTINESEVGAFVKEMKDLIANDRLDPVFERMGAWLEASDTEAHNQLLILERKYKDNKKNSRLGIISSSEAGLAKNQVTYGLLEMLTELQQAAG